MLFLKFHQLFPEKKNYFTRQIFVSETFVVVLFKSKKVRIMLVAARLFFCIRHTMSSDNEQLTARRVQDSSVLKGMLFAALCAVFSLFLSLPCLCYILYLD